MVGDIGGESVFGSPAGARAKRQPGPYGNRRCDKARDDQGPYGPADPARILHRVPFAVLSERSLDR
jgi:hypothetical protein